MIFKLILPISNIYDISSDMKIFRYNASGQINVIEADKISIEDLNDSWLDLKEELPENLFGIRIEKSVLNEDEYCQIEDGTNYTLVKIGYIGKDNKFKTIFAILTNTTIITIHKEDCTPINRLLKNINAIVKDEKENIEKFKDFIISQILYEVANENMTAISRTEDNIENLRKVEDFALLTEISGMRGYIRKFSRVILYQSAIINDIKRGGGEFINKRSVYDYCVDALAELNKYGKLVAGLEKELNEIVQTIESEKISKYTEYTARLNIAIEILTRASVLLMIPNSIFTLWPAIFAKEDLVLGMPNYYLEISIAVVSIILSQWVLSLIYKRSSIANK